MWIHAGLRRRKKAGATGRPLHTAHPLAYLSYLSEEALLLVKLVSAVWCSRMYVLLGVQLWRKDDVGNGVLRGDRGGCSSVRQRSATCRGSLALSGYIVRVRFRSGGGTAWTCRVLGCCDSDVGRN